MKGEVADEPAPGVLGRAEVIREGGGASIVTYGAATHTTLAAAETLAGEGVEVEVIDLKTLQPWDEAAVLASLARTHHLVVVHEAVEAFGVGAEVAARMADVGFEHLDGPIARVGAPFMPVPFARSLEQAYLPSAEDVVAAVRRVME
jgi:pyruvate dehydrogenase E1 component beta subunit